MVLHQTLVSFSEHACMFLSRPPSLTFYFRSVRGWLVRWFAGQFRSLLWLCRQSLAGETASHGSVCLHSAACPFSSRTCSPSTPHGSVLALAWAASLLAAVLGPSPRAAHSLLSRCEPQSQGCFEFCWTWAEPVSSWQHLLPVTFTFRH